MLPSELRWIWEAPLLLSASAPRSEAWLGCCWGCSPHVTEVETMRPGPPAGAASLKIGLAAAAPDGAGELLLLLFWRCCAFAASLMFETQTTHCNGL